MSGIDWDAVDKIHDVTGLPVMLILALSAAAQVGIIKCGTLNRFTQAQAADRGNGVQFVDNLREATGKSAIVMPQGRGPSS